MNFLTKVITASALTFSLANATPHTLDSAHSEVGFSVKHLMITNVKENLNHIQPK